MLAQSSNNTVAMVKPPEGRNAKDGLDFKISQVLNRLPPKQRKDAIETIKKQEREKVMAELQRVRKEAEKREKQQEADLMADFLAATDSATVDKAAAFIKDIEDDLNERKARDDVETRRDFFKELCLHWHPDKCPADKETATKIFLMLQGKKEWFTS